MAATLEISYFNSFWMKAVNNNGDGGGAWTAEPVWPNGYPYNASTDPFGLGILVVTDFETFYVI